MLSRNIHLLSNDTIAGLAGHENRRGGRFGMVDVKSDLGRVLDLSHCGALVVKRRFQRLPVLATFPITIRHKDLQVVLEARLARKQQVKGIGTVMGLELLRVTDAKREVIKEIIMRCRHWNVLPEQQDAA